MSKELRLTEGDRNTKYFHTHASPKNNRNFHKSRVNGSALDGSK